MHWLDIGQCGLDIVSPGNSMFQGDPEIFVVFNIYGFTSVFGRNTVMMSLHLADPCSSKMRARRRLKRRVYRSKV